MRKVEVLGLAVIVMAAQFVLFLAAPRASAFIPEPYELYGVAYQESGDVLPNGAPIRTFVDGAEFSNKTSVFSRRGYNDGWFDVDTYGNYKTNLTDPGTPSIKEGADDDEPIMYTWGDMSNNTQLNVSQPWLTGMVFKEMHNWQTGLPPQAGDLNASPSSLQPPLLKIQSIVTNSSIAPNHDYVTLCNPTPYSVEASEFYIEKDILGSAWGPTVSITPGTIPPYSDYFVDIGLIDYFVDTGDNVKLVWKNNATSIDSPFAGLNLTVDRVEFNASSGGTLFWEPGNTIQRDEISPPGYGFQINRSASCWDTNSEKQDFFVSLEPGFTNNPPLAPDPICLQGLCSNNIDSRLYHITTLTSFPINWTHRDPEGDLQTQAQVSMYLGATLIWSTAVGGSMSLITFTGVLLYCSDYELRVRTKDLWAWGPYKVLPFHTNCAPTGLSNLAPPNGARPNPKIDQMVWWSLATDLDPGDQVNYTWQVSLDLGFVVMTSTGTTANNNSAPFVTIPYTCYFWRVNASDGWVNIPYTSPWQFCTEPPTPPIVDLTRPVGGEYWRGGSVQLVTWTASDNTTPSTLLVFYLNYTSSAGSGTIGSITGANSIMWTLPLIDATDVRVNITAIDQDGMKDWDESGPLTIDSTPPSLTSYSPTGWNIPLNSQVTASFSEPVNNMSTQMRQSFGLLEQSTGKWLTVTWIRLPAFDWPTSVRFVPTAPLKTCGGYTAHVNNTFHDRAYWQLLNPTGWTFHTICAPRVSIVPPLADGKVWSGGTGHPISWTMTDEVDAQLKVWLNYSVNRGADLYPHSSYLDLKSTGTVTFSWAVPLVDTTGARFRVTVMDASGLTATATSGNFTIDSTPPSILASVPSNNSHGIKNNQLIQVVFDEGIVRSSAEQAFSISPNPGSLRLSWETTSMGKDMLVVDHSPFKPHTDYKVTFDTRLKDKSDPGNSPRSALVFIFSTKPPPNVQPPVAKAVGKNQVHVGEPVTFDGRGSSGNITKYVWTIKDNQNNIVEVLVGSVVQYTFTKHGRYNVVLRVLDEPNGVYDEDTLEIAVTSNDNAWLLLLLIAALFASIAIGGTEVGRVAVLTMIAAPSYRRKQKGKEDAETRGMVKGYIIVHPGDTYTDIKRNLEIGNGSLTYHLMRLEKDAVIKSQVQGTRKKYFPVGMASPVEDGGELHDIERRLLNAVSGNPGMTVKILAEELGVSSQLTLYHLRRLSQRHRILLERRGFKLRAHPAERRES